MRAQKGKNPSREWVCMDLDWIGRLRGAISTRLVCVSGAFESLWGVWCLCRAVCARVCVWHWATLRAVACLLSSVSSLQSPVSHVPSGGCAVIMSRPCHGTWGWRRRAGLLDSNRKNCLNSAFSLIFLALVVGFVSVVVLEVAHVATAFQSPFPAVSTLPSFSSLLSLSLFLSSSQSLSLRRDTSWL